jgi:hypothetical protein
MGDRRLLVGVVDERGAEVLKPRPVAADGTAVLEPLPEGGYQATVIGSRPGIAQPVTKPFVVLNPDAET